MTEDDLNTHLAHTRDFTEQANNLFDDLINDNLQVFDLVYIGGERKEVTAPRNPQKHTELKQAQSQVNTALKALQNTLQRCIDEQKDHYLDGDTSV